MPTERDAPRCETCGHDDSHLQGHCEACHDWFDESDRSCHHAFVAARPSVEGLLETDDEREIREQGARDLLAHPYSSVVSAYVVGYQRAVGAAEAERDRLRELLETTYEREAREHYEQWKRDIEDAALGEDELSRYDNRTMDCPACGQRGVSCERCDGDVHDACLGHIEGATSACCGHGIGLGHIDIGGYMARAASTEGEGGEGAQGGC